MKILNSVENIDTFIKENRFSIIYFSSNSCGVCIGLLPKIQQLLKAYPRINYAKVEVDKTKEAAAKFSVFTLPCIIGFIDETEIIREARFISIIELEKKIKRYYELME